LVDWVRGYIIRYGADGDVLSSWCLQLIIFL
jgi:hypothetical protein